MDFIQGASRKQILLLPESVEDFISEDNPVRFIDAFVDSLKLKKLGFKSLPSTGRPPYNPSDLLKLFLYGYINTIRSSRRLERETKRNLELLWLLKKLQPDFKTIADFRKDNATPIKKVCQEFTLLCQQQNLFGAEFVVIDGTKIRAVNSFEKNITARRQKARRIEIGQKISDYFKDLDFYDKQESTPYKEATVKELKEKIGQLEKEKKVVDDREEQLRSSPDHQISYTDPDSRSMMMSGRTEVGYNCQTVVDDKYHMIVDHEVVNNPSDQNQLFHMAHRAKKILRMSKLEVVADKGYYNGPDILKNERGRMTRYYVTPACRKCPLKIKCTRGEQRMITRWEHDDIMDRMRERVRNNPEIMKKRKCIVEHPYGTMKRWWDQGYFLMKGLKNVRTEFSLSVFAYNLTRAINILGVKRLIQAVS